MAFQPVGYAPVIIGAIYVHVNELVGPGHVERVPLQPGEQVAQAAPLPPFQNTADVKSSDERRMGLCVFCWIMMWGANRPFWVGRRCYVFKSSCFDIS